MLTLSDWRVRFDRLHDTSGMAERTAQRSGEMMADCLEDEDLDWYVHQGDLVVPDDLDVDMALVGDGDLVVHGFVDDYVSDIGMLVVPGDLVVRDLVSWGGLYIEGDLRSHGVVYGYYNDFTFEVGGAVHARAPVLRDKPAEYRTGEVEAEIDSYHPTDEQFRAAREIFVPQVYDGWKKRHGEGRQPRPEHPSYWRICSRLHAGKPLFQDAGGR